MNIKEKKLIELIEQQIALIETQESHIDTLKRILVHLQKELLLIQVRPDNPVDIEEQQQMITELINWIDLLMEAEQ